MLKTLLAAAVSIMAASAVQAQDAPDIEVWRLDCGTIGLSDTAPFSDTHLYDGEERALTSSCYLIRNGAKYLLWDTGLSGDLKGQSVTDGVFTVSVDRTIIEQLGDLELSADDIGMVAASHYHFDHIGQLAGFKDATLLIGAADWSAVNSEAEGQSFIDKAPFAPWLGDDAGEVTAIAKDHDVFGDGSVIIKSMPGHTPGHSALLVRLPETGNIMLTGDLYHFEEQVTNRGVPQFNTNRADTLASMARFDQMAANLDATVVIQHDPRHLDRLPAFPESAK